ncbi:MAG TPA: M56 family metallopeptidase [Gemmatimonadaceae bacterium]|nr:M56 family metallopeptidase [Gemmatimonadaceae bacterium]
MIAAWMLYTLAVSALLFAGALAADYFARALGAPTRFLWAACMLAVLCLSTRALANGREPRQVVSMDSGRERGHSVTTVVPSSDVASARQGVHSDAGRVESFTIALRGAAGVARRVLVELDIAPLERWNVALVALWIASSGAAFAWIAISLIRTRRVERRLLPERIDAQAVLVSHDVGPALFGIVRFRIVVPRWVLSLPKWERHIILAHEREHATAFDPALLCAAAVALALQPWNPLLWATLIRLRLALETDCDRRVLASAHDVRRYGELLVAVHTRTTPALAPHVAFVERSSNLEQRIRRMTRRPRLLSSAGAGSLMAAMALSTAAWTVSAPARRTVEQQAAIVRRATRIPSKCMFGGRINNSALPNAKTPADGSCAIDGEILVFALDSSRVLVSVRDSADAKIEAVDYFIFTAEAGSVPTNLSWSTHAGHMEIRFGEFYVASPAPGIHGLAFQIAMDDVTSARQSRIRELLDPDRYLNAHRFVAQEAQILRRPQITWDVLRQVPLARRCGPSDSAGTPRDCFVIGGKAFLLTAE